MRAVTKILLCSFVVVVSGCTAASTIKFICEGKCSGELSRDIDASSPEQLKARTPQ